MSGSSPSPAWKAAPGSPSAGLRRARRRRVPSPPRLRHQLLAFLEQHRHVFPSNCKGWPLAGKICGMSRRSWCEVDTSVVVVANSYAQQKFRQAVDALIGHETLQLRLTYAMDSLSELQARDLPQGMHADFKALKSALMREPLATQSGLVARNLDDDEADRWAEKILNMYTKLLG